MSIKYTKPLSDKEEAEIQKQIAADPDDSDATDAEIAQAKPFKDALPELYASIQRTRGRPKSEAPKEAVTLRLDPATLERFKATGENWRAKMSEVLDHAKL